MREARAFWLRKPGAGEIRLVLRLRQPGAVEASLVITLHKSGLASACDERTLS